MFLNNLGRCRLLRFDIVKYDVQQNLVPQLLREQKGAGSFEKYGRYSRLRRANRLLAQNS